MLNTVSFYLSILLIILIFFFFISWLYIATVLYFLPLIIAYIRKHDNIIPIAILNIFLGWLPLGWIAALLWSLNRDIKKDDTEEDY